MSIDWTTVASSILGGGGVGWFTGWTGYRARRTTQKVENSRVDIRAYENARKTYQDMVRDQAAVLVEAREDARAAREQAEESERRTHELEAQTNDLNAQIIRLRRLVNAMVRLLRENHIEPPDDTEMLA